MKKALLFAAAAVFACPFPASVFAAGYTTQVDLAQKPRLPYGATDLPDRDIAATQPFTFPEFTNFIRDWRKYKRWLDEGNNRYKAVAYLGVSPSTDYPPEVLRWCDEHGWTADRFFLLERKMRIGLTAVQQEERRTVMENQLRAQIKTIRENTELSAQERATKEKDLVRQIHRVWKNTEYKAPITPSEFEMIKFNKTAVASTLKD